MIMNKMRVAPKSSQTIRRVDLVLRMFPMLYMWFTVGRYNPKFSTLPCTVILESSSIVSLTGVSRFWESWIDGSLCATSMQTRVLQLLPMESGFT